jgi:hypothetical protein
MCLLEHDDLKHSKTSLPIAAIFSYFSLFFWCFTNEALAFNFNTFEARQLPESVMKTVATIEAHGLRISGLKQLLKMVHFGVAQDAMSSRFAIFNSKVNKIILNESLSSQVPLQRLLVVAHELGHAFVYLKMTPAELYRWSEELGPWNARFVDDSREHTASFEDHAFLEAHPLSRAPNQIIGDLPNTPTRYALSNRHEWIAECFASWIVNQINSTGTIKVTGPIDDELQLAFTKRLKR